MELLPILMEKRVNEKFPGLISSLKNCDDGTLEADKLNVCNLTYQHDLVRTMSISAACVLGAEIDFLYNWMKFRPVYKIDPILSKMLAKDATEAIRMDKKIPVSMLLDIPYPCMYVEIKPFSIHTKHPMPVLVKVDGESHYEESLDIKFTGRFFVKISEYKAFSLNCLNVYFEKENGDFADYNMPLIEGATINEAMICLQETLNAKTMAYVNDRDRENVMVIERFLTCFASQILLYLHAENTDIVHKKVQQQPKKQKKNRKGNKSKQPNVFEVGYRFGKEIRTSVVKYEYETSTSSDSQPSPKQKGGHGTPKCSHIRAGHTHNVWVGKRNSPERRLVCKWFGPTIVHPEGWGEISTIYTAKATKSTQNH